MMPRDRRSSPDEWSEDTRPGRPLLRPSLQQEAAKVEPEDDDTQLGMLMRQTVNNTNAITQLSTAMGTLEREVRQHQRGIDQDRPVLAQGAAKHASNRAAVLMGGLFTVYEVVHPYLVELWRQLHNR